MAGDEHDVVDPTEQPEVAVVVALGAVAREVLAVEARPVGVAVALAGRPRCRAASTATAATTRGSRRRGCRPACPRRRRCSPRCRAAGTSRCPGFNVVAPGSALIMIAPVSVCHHVSTTGHRSPPIVAVVPDPRLGIDRFADGADQPQRRQVVRGGKVVAPLHERSDRGRRGVEDRHLVLLDDRPEPILARVVGRALVEHRRGAVRERAVDDVRVAGDPADVGGAPVDVGVGLQVEDVLVRVRDLREVAAGRVHDALGLPGGARRVEDEQQILGVHRLGRALGALARDLVVPPEVAARLASRTPTRCAAARARARSTACRRAPRRRCPSAATTEPRRHAPSAVISTRACASLMRSFSDCAVKPPNTTECAAPMRAHASIAATVSGTMPM